MTYTAAAPTRERQSEEIVEGWRAFERSGCHYLYRQTGGTVLGVAPDAFRVLTSWRTGEAAPAHARANRPDADMTDADMARELIAELEEATAELPALPADRSDPPAVRSLALTALPDDDAKTLIEQAAAAVRIVVAAPRALPGPVRLHLALGDRVGEGELVGGVLRRVHEEARRHGATVSLSAELSDQLVPSDETLLLLATGKVRPVLMVRSGTPPQVRRQLVRRIDERIGIREMVAVLALDGSPSALMEALEQLRGHGFGAICLIQPRAPAALGGHREERLAAYLSGWAEEVIVAACEGRRHPTLVNWAEVGRRLRAGTMGSGSNPCARGGFAVDARGDLYADPRLVGEERGRVGTLAEGLDPARLATFAQAERAARAGCVVCPAEWSCAIDRLLAADGAFDERVSCRILRHVLELGIHVQARIAAHRPDLLPLPPGATPSPTLRLGAYEIHRLNP